MLGLSQIIVDSRQNLKTDESTDSSGSRGSRVVGSAVRQIKNGSIPLATGTTLLLRSIRGRKKQNHTAVRLLAATGLIAIGLRQRRQYGHPLSQGESGNHHHAGSGTYEQRADSHHEDTNPRGTASEPEVEQSADSGSGRIQFSHDQGEETEAAPPVDEEPTGDPRIDEDVTKVDLSTASLVDEASEAAGPSSVQSQPTQTDELEPEETPEEDTSHLDAEREKTDEADDGDDSEDE